MPEILNAPTDTWNVLLVEDDATVRRQVCEYLAEESFASRKLIISEIPDLDKALNLIHERKADLVILDIYRGTARKGGEQTGIRILESIKKSGFVPVVLYTALPEGLEEQQSSFVRLVGKDVGGLERLKAEITELFRIHVPQVHRAVVNHLDRALCSYMWEFVQAHWAEFSSLADKPEFLRLIVQRLAMTFAREGIGKMTEEVYGILAAEATNVDTVHPAEYYIKPPIGQDPMLGDIRLRQSMEKIEYLVVLWPSCDMVSTGGRKPKTQQVLCARSALAKDAPEVVDWVNDPSNTKEKKVKRLVKNTRDESPERYHFLPGVWDIPNLVVDFQALEHITLSEVRAYTCLGTLASPFAEALGARFQRYIGRIGTPDLEVNTILTQIRERSAPAGSGGTNPLPDTGQTQQ
jgi:CheY-like chemotaxis protein